MILPTSSKYNIKSLLLITTTICIAASPSASATTSYFPYQNDQIDHSYSSGRHNNDQQNPDFSENNTATPYLLDKYKSEKEQSRKDFFVAELVQDFYSLDDLKFEDDDLNEKSFKYALEFLLQMPESLGIPSYDIHPDGEFSFVWRKEGTGIIALSFSENGDINYASYSPSTNIRHKGLLSFDDLLFNSPEHKKASVEDTIIFTLIKKFS